MRLLVLTSSFPRYTGDLTCNFLYEWTCSVKTRASKLLVVAPSDEKNLTEDFVHDQPVYRFNYFFPRSLQRLAYRNGMPDNIKDSLSAKLQIIPFLLSFLYHGMKLAHNYDCICCHWIIPSGLVGVIIKKIFRVKLVITIHSTDLQILAKWRLGPVCARMILKNCDHITTVSQNTKQRLLHLIGSKYKADFLRKVSVIPMGIHTDKYLYDSNVFDLKKKYHIEYEKIVLYIGRLVSVKGVRYLIEAMNGFKDILLIIMGDGDKRGELMKQAKEWNCNCVFLSQGTEQEKLDFFNFADVVVIPSVELTDGRTEGLPVLMLESMASGKAVIASDVGSINEVLHHGYNGILVQPGSPDQIREAIIALFGNAADRHHLGLRSRKTAEAFDWNNISKKFWRVYEQIGLIPACTDGDKAHVAAVVG